MQYISETSDKGVAIVSQKFLQPIYPNIYSNKNQKENPQKRGYLYRFNETPVLNKIKSATQYTKKHTTNIPVRPTAAFFCSRGQRALILKYKGVSND